MMRIFLSLQVVSNLEPSQFQQAEYTKSGWLSITTVGSPVPTFQMTTKLSEPFDCDNEWQRRMSHKNENSGIGKKKTSRTRSE